jgi:hypothetical protein
MKVAKVSLNSLSPSDTYYLMYRYTYICIIRNHFISYF